MGTLLVLWMLIGGAVGTAIGASKGRLVFGLLLGTLLGWVGWIVVAVSPPSPERQAEHDLRVAQAAARLRGDVGMPADAPTRTSVEAAARDRLAALDNLHRSGTLSDDEYRAKRASIIAEI